MGSVITDLMEKNELTRNQVSQISGLSNSHIIALERENIVRIRRDTVISLALALNSRLGEINELLDHFGMSALATRDVPVIIKAADKRMITGIQPLHEGIGLDIMLVAMEKAEGDLVIVDGKPSAALLPADYLSPADERIAAEFPIYRDVKREFNRMRTVALNETLITHSVHFIACSDCIRQYMRKGLIQKHLLKMHFLTLIDYLKKPNYQFDLIRPEACPSFRFQIKFASRCDAKAKDMAFLIGNGNRSDRSEGLQGFATDHKKMVSYLELDYSRLEGEIYSEFSDKEAMCQRLKEMFKEETGMDLEG